MSIGQETPTVVGLLRVVDVGLQGTDLVEALAEAAGVVVQHFRCVLDLAHDVVPEGVALQGSPA